MNKLLALLLLFASAALAQVPSLKQGGTGVTSAADDSALISDGSQWLTKVLPDCNYQNSSLQYDNATNAFSCVELPSNTVLVTDSNNVDCSLTTAQNSGVSSALTAAAGKPLVIPEDCIISLSGPSADSYLFNVAGNTKIICKSPYAGFKLGSKTCSGGTNAGAACAANGDCQSNSCVGTQFAPTGGSYYGIFNSSAGADGIEIENCAFYAKQTDGYLTCVGGSDAGKPCKNTCTTDANQLCTANSQCPSSGTCTMATCAGGGTCTGAAGNPSGAGNIVIADFSASKRVKLKNISVWDLQKTSTLVKLGNFGTVEGFQAILFSDDYPDPKAYTLDNAGYTAASALPHSGSVGTLIEFGNKSIYEHGRIFLGSGQGLKVGDYSTVTDSHFYGYTDDPIMVRTAGMFNIIDANVMERGKIGVFAVGTDGIIQNNTIQNFYLNSEAFGVQMAGAGNQLRSNNLIYSRGLGLGYSGSELLSAGCGHCQAYMNFFGTLWLGISDVTFLDPGKRCTSGTDKYKRCSTSADCAASAPCTQETSVADFKAKHNWHYFEVGGVAYDFTGVGNAPVRNSDISNNEITNTTTGFAFPASQKTDVFQNKFNHNTFWQVTTPVSNWYTAYGEMSNQQGMLVASAENYGLISAFTGTTTGAIGVPVGDAAEVASTDHKATQAAADSAKVIGVGIARGVCTGGTAGANTLYPCTSNSDCTNSGVCKQDPVAIAHTGVASCNIGSSVTRGDRLKVGTNGDFITAGSTEHGVALALASATSGTVKCLLGSQPAAIPATPTPPAQLIVISGANECGVTAAGSGVVYLGRTCSTTESDVSFPAPATGNFNRLYCRNDTDTTCTVTYSLRVNGSTSANITCNATNTAGCSDTTGTEAVTAGQLVSVVIDDTADNCTANIPTACTLTLQPS